MIEDPNLTELWQTKAKIAGRFATVKEYAEAVMQLAKERPLPPPGKQRKMIPGFPRGQSVGDVDPIMQEVYDAKEALAKRFGYDIHRMAEYFRSQESKTVAPKKSASAPKSQKFRSTKSKRTTKRGNSDER